MYTYKHKNLELHIVKYKILSTLYINEMNLKTKAK